MAKCRSESPHRPAASVCHHPSVHRGLGRIPNHSVAGKEGEPHPRHHQQGPRRRAREIDTGRHAISFPRLVRLIGEHAPPSNRGASDRRHVTGHELTCICRSPGPTLQHDLTNSTLIPQAHFLIVSSESGDMLIRFILYYGYRFTVNKCYRTFTVLEGRVQYNNFPAPVTRRTP